MSYFNSDQEAYMESLAKITPKEKCWCGWDRFGHCHNPNCKPELTNADKCWPCGGTGKCWANASGERVYRTCADCNGTGMKPKEGGD